MKNLIFYIPLFFLFSCKSAKEIDTRWARDRNIGSKLIGKTVVYTVFVDTKTSLPFSGFDIASTKDSLNRVYQWVSEEAKKYNQNLEIIPIYFQTTSKFTINKNLPYDRLSQAFEDGEYSNESKLGKWATAIVKLASKEVNLPNGEVLPAKPKLKPFEALVTKLKLIHKAENVVVFFMINNYYIIDISAVINHMQDKEIEFAINSGKNTNLLAAQLLTLFGAQNLASGNNSSYVIKKIEIAEKQFPKDVMRDYESDLGELNIGEFTAYMLGWSQEVKPEYVDLFKVEPLKKKKDERFK